MPVIPRKTVPIACNGCTECCRGPRELLLDEEDIDRYPTYVKNGKHYLERKENEDCIYFDGKCSIYETRPQTCRRFDCRDWIDHPELPERIRIKALERT